MTHKSLLAIAMACTCTPLAQAQTVLSGLDFIYSYDGFGDTSLAENQDRISDDVWITRNATRGIFNIAQEPFFQGMGASSPSPIGTQWAIGTTADWNTLTYGTWGQAHGGVPTSLIDVNVVVYLENDDTYIDLMFTSWGIGGTGGTFSYTRSIVPTPASALPLAIAGLLATRRRR